MSILTSILATILSVVAIGISYFKPVPVPVAITPPPPTIVREVPPLQSLGAAGTEIPKAIALFETSLASAISSSAESMTLISATDKAGTTLASSTYAFIIDEGSASEEFVIADCTGTACANMIRGLSPITGTSTVAALQKTHRRGASVKITDAPQLLILSRMLNGQGFFPSILRYGFTPTFTYGSRELVTWDKSKEYSDSIALAGGSDSSGTVKGFLEKGSALEAASSTADGSGNTTAPLALTTSISSAGCTVKGQAVVVTRTDGRISPNCVSTSTAYSFYGISVLGGNNSFGGATTTLTATKPTFGIGTSTPSVNGLSNAGNTYLSRGVGIGDATTTSSANLYVAGHSIFANTATTSKLIVSKCVGCINGYERITGAAHDCTTGATSCSSTATCSTGKKVIGGGFTYVQNTQVTAAGGYPSGDTTFIGQITCTTNCGSASVVGYAICAYP